MGEFQQNALSTPDQRVGGEKRTEASELTQKKRMIPSVGKGVDEEPTQKFRASRPDEVVLVVVV